MRKHLAFGEFPLLYDLVIHLVDLGAESGFDAFPEKFQCVTVGDGFVVIVFMKVIAKYLLAFIVTGDERSSCKTDQDGLAVGIDQV